PGGRATRSRRSGFTDRAQTPSVQPAQIVAALLSASDAPLAAADIAAADDSLAEGTVEAAIHELRQSYEREGRAFQIYELAGGFQILTRPEFAPYLERFDTV